MKLLQKFIFGLLLFNEVICTACNINTPTCTKFILCSYYRSLIDTLGNQKKRSKQRAEYLQKQNDI